MEWMFGAAVTIYGLRHSHSQLAHDLTISYFSALLGRLCGSTIAILYSRCLGVASPWSCSFVGAPLLEGVLNNSLCSGMSCMLVFDITLFVVWLSAVPPFFALYCCWVEWMLLAFDFGPPVASCIRLFVAPAWLASFTAVLNRGLQRAGHPAACMRLCVVVPESCYNCNCSCIEQQKSNGVALSTWR